MSANLDIAIYNRLTGIETLTGAAAAAQAALIAFLATDPDTAKPAVYNMNLNDAQLTDGSGNKIVLYPCLTFRQSAGAADRSMWNTGAIHETAMYDVEVWSDKRTNLPVKQALENVDRLLDYRLGAVNETTNPLVITDGRVMVSQSVITLNSHYDRAIHAWAGTVRYAITMSRW